MNSRHGRVSLSRLFDELNEKLFYGRLPKYRVVFCDKAFGAKDGQCLQERRLIRLSHSLQHDAQRLRRTLIHEMCHHGCPHHGKRFITKLDRLASMGEAWATEEAEEYRNAATWNDEMREIKDMILELASQHNRGKRKLRFSDVKQLVGDRLGLTFKEVDRKIWWLRSAWQTAVATNRGAR